MLGRKAGQGGKERICILLWHYCWRSYDGWWVSKRGIDPWWTTWWCEVACGSKVSHKINTDPLSLEDIQAKSKQPGINACCFDSGIACPDVDSGPQKRDGSLLVFALFIKCDLKPASISRGNVCPRSQISSSFRILGFWSSGASWNRSFIRMGRTSVIFCTPEANVPGAALRDTACPAFLARSSHWRTTVSTTYRTPSLCVAALFLN